MTGLYPQAWDADIESFAQTRWRPLRTHPGCDTFPGEPDPAAATASARKHNSLALEVAQKGKHGRDPS